MSDVVIPWGLLFYFGVRWLLSSTKEAPDNDEESVAPIAYYPTGIQYFSNGKIINEPHHIHYLRTLDLLSVYGHVADESIKEAVKQKFIEIENQEFFYHAQIDEVAAAREFLLDQYNYIVRKN